MDSARDPFAPLSEVELADAARQSEQFLDHQVAKPICPPLDAESGVLAASRLFGRKPDGVWRYETAGGETAFHALRWNEPDGKKTFRPLSWCDGDGWRFVAWPDGRPVYNLQLVVQQPGAPIVVCEGEKAADAAAHIFPKSIVTTSSGGAGAASKTDWSALAGRDVLIWPDRDLPGDRYTREVAAALTALDCSVSIINAKALASIDPGGGAREPQEKWDAADAAAEWSDLGALRRAAHGSAKSFDPGPRYQSHGAFTMTADGLKVECSTGRGDKRETTSEAICGPFEILGKSRNVRGGDRGLLLRWRDSDGRTHERLVTFAALHGDPAGLCQALAADGLHIERSKQRALADYLNGTDARGRVTRVESTGWHLIGGSELFVLPFETIGPVGAEAVVLEGGASAPYEACGGLADWRTDVGALASGQTLPTLAISAALAGPLLYLANGEGGGVHFFGQSSKGKTTVLQAAASVWGRGASPGYLRAWRATANGLEGGAALATDTALVLDEMGVLEPREAAAAIYGLANGAGKQRAGRDGALREPKSWRVSIVSSGEIPIEAKLIEGKGRARAGQLVRLLDIPADRGLGFGAFNNGGETGDAGVLARAIKTGASMSYGTAGPEFVRRMIMNNVNSDDVRAMIADFVKAECPPKADGQIERAAQRLGLIAAAGELAIVSTSCPGQLARRARRRLGRLKRGSKIAVAPSRPKRGRPAPKCDSISSNMATAVLIPLTTRTPSLRQTGPAGARARARRGNGSFRRKRGRQKFAWALIRNTWRGRWPSMDCCIALVTASSRCEASMGRISASTSFLPASFPGTMMPPEIVKRLALANPELTTSDYGRSGRSGVADNPRGVVDAPHYARKPKKYARYVRYAMKSTIRKYWKRARSRKFRQCSGRGRRAVGDYFGDLLSALRRRFRPPEKSKTNRGFGPGLAASSTMRPAFSTVWVRWHAVQMERERFVRRPV